MKQVRHHITGLLAAASLTLAVLPACTLETSDNGDLDGYWHLVRVDTLATGGVRDMSEELVFWAVQMNLMNVMDRRGIGNNLLIRFDNHGTELRLYEPYVNDRIQGDIPIDDVEQLRPLGINALDETFAVERLDGGRMTLSSANGYRLDFCKM